MSEILKKILSVAVVAAIVASVLMIRRRMIFAIKNTEKGNDKNV